MRKILSSVALAMAIMVAGSAYAQNDTIPSAKQQCENCNNEKGTKGVKKEHKGKKDLKGEKKGQKGGKDFKGEKGPKFNPFEGIQLTADQQQKLQALREGLGPVNLDKAQQEKVYGKDGQKPGKENLTVEQKKQMKEQKKQMKAERKAQKMEAKKKYLDGVKGILTPEQYVVFLENVYMFKG